METTVRNLELTWHDQLEDDSLDEVGEMAGGLPFEKQREHQLELDRPAIARETYGRSHPRRRFLTAHFGDELVGAVAVTTIRDDADEVTDLLLEHELVQRNRDDIRGRLLETVNDEYPDATLHQQIPAQNRTARQYLQRHDRVTVESTQTILQLHWPVGDSDSAAGLDNETGIPTDGLSTPTWSLIRQDDTAREALNVIEDDLIVSRTYKTKEDARTRQLLHVGPDELTKNSLLGTIHNWATDHEIDHLEWPITESVLEIASSLTNSIEIINKRVQYRFKLE